MKRSKIAIFLLFLILLVKAKLPPEDDEDNGDDGDDGNNDEVQRQIRKYILIWKTNSFILLFFMGKLFQKYMMMIL